VRSANAAKARGLVLGACLPWSREPLFIDTLARVNAGEIGGLHAIEAAWRGTSWRGGASDVVLADCVQSVDRANALLGAYPESAEGTMAGDAYLLRYRYAGGATVTLRVSPQSGMPLGCHERLAGRDGTIALENAHLRSQAARTQSVAAFLRAMEAPTVDGPLAPDAGFKALVATTRSVILGREAARSAATLRWDYLRDKIYL